MKKSEKRYVPLERGHIQLGKNEESALLEWSKHDVYSIRKTPNGVPVTIQDPDLLKNPQIHPGKRILETSLTWMKWIYGPRELIEKLFTANAPTRVQKMRRFLAAKTSVLNRIDHVENGTEHMKGNPHAGDLSAMRNGELQNINNKIALLRWECTDIVEAAHQDLLKAEIEAIMQDEKYYQHMMQETKRLGEKGAITKHEAWDEYETYRMLARNGHEREIKLLVALRDAQKEYLDAYKALQLLEEENEKKTINSLS